MGNYGRKNQCNNVDNGNLEFNEVDWIRVGNKLEQGHKDVQARWSKEIEEAHCLFDFEASEQLDGDSDIESLCDRKVGESLPKVIFKDTPIDLFLKTHLLIYF